MSPTDWEAPSGTGAGIADVHRTQAGPQAAHSPGGRGQTICRVLGAMTEGLCSSRGLLAPCHTRFPQLLLLVLCETEPPEVAVS